MDIMNNMTVSTSKLTFSLIAIAALLVSGTGILVQEVSAANAPEFTAKHLNTTLTEVTFNQNLNGTLRVLDWGIFKHSCAAPCTTNANAVDGVIVSEVNISNIINSTTTSGTTQEGGYPFVASRTTIASANDKTYSGIGAANTGLGFINNSNTIYLIHAAIPTNAQYFVNYTNNPAAPNDYLVGDTGAFSVQVGAGAGAGSSVENVSMKFLKIGSNATATDNIPPTVSSAEILKSNPKLVKIYMSENITNLNTTLTGFTLTTAGGNNAAIVSGTVVTANPSSADNFIYVNLQNAVSPLDVLTISYGVGNTDKGWITDAVNSERHIDDAGADGGAVNAHGNRMGNFTVSITNWLEVGMYGDVTTCYDCNAPTVTDVKISLDSSVPITVTDDNKVHINAGIGDTVSVIVTVNDNLGGDTIPFAGLYTDFGNTPDNLFYANNFDTTKQMSTSYYEWNARNDDIAFTNTGAVTWSDATAQVNSDRTKTLTYTMTINESIESSQVWVDIGDKTGNYAKLALPITLEVSGAPGLTFASDDTQKVVSFFNESILLAIVSQWTATSSDDASNVEQLSSVLGIESQLPTWTTELASWVADDKIDVADMIVAVEYVINL